MRYYFFDDSDRFAKKRKIREPTIRGSLMGRAWVPLYSTNVAPISTASARASAGFTVSSDAAAMTIVGGCSTDIGTSVSGNSLMVFFPSEKRQVAGDG